jgi:predicted unusual protein kinase regulating ubiquinone biosynthesis (AarF/ABC1/UbiB family)
MPKSPKATTAPRTGKLARGAIAGVAIARMGAAQLVQTTHKLVQGGQASASTQATHDATMGRIVFGALNQLKGTALKASQLLSLELGLLPDGMRQELERAHHQVTPLNRALVLKMLRQELGAGPDELFASFEPQAFAAASLGQVHAATLHNGQAVAVKLQYPGMQASITSDLGLLRTLLRTLGAGTDVLPRPEVVDAMLHTISSTLHEELDYGHEAAQLQWFATHLQLPDVVVPQAVPERSSTRVLTMQRLYGLHLDAWLATHPTQAARNHFGQRLWDLFLHGFFVMGRVHADPHPGNYLFMPEGQLGVLDFGCTRTLTPGFAAQLARAWSAWLHTPRDVATVHAAYSALGLLEPGMPESTFAQALVPALSAQHDWQCTPFQTPVFDFTNYPTPPQFQTVQRSRALQQVHQIPPDLPFFDRSYWGLVQMLRKLGAQVRTINPWIHP